MSFDMEPYDVDDDKENEYDGTRLRVRYKGNLIGFASTRAAAYDIMEEHANSPCMSMEVSADMADMEQQIIDLAQEVDYMESERDYWKELSLSRDDTLLSNSFERWQELSLPRDGQQVYTQADVDKAVDAERKRSWKENKAFQWELAEQNAILRAQLGEKHDDNCRLQRSLAEEHNKLKVALQPQEDVDFKNHVGTDYWWQTETDYKLIVDKVNILWEERYDS